MNRSVTNNLCVLLFFLTFSSFAQVQMGIVSGWSGSKFTGFVSGWSDYRTKTGLSLGAKLEIPLYRNIASQVQMLYVQNGTNVTFFNDTGPNIPAKINLHQLEFPIQLKYNFIRGPFKSYLLGGIEMGLILAARENDFIIPGVFDGSIDLLFSGFSSDVNFGSGISIAFPSFSLWVEATYHWGLNDVFQDEQRLYTSRLFIRNKTHLNIREIRILTGISIPLS